MPGPDAQAEQSPNEQAAQRSNNVLEQARPTVPAIMRAPGVDTWTVRVGGMTEVVQGTEKRLELAKQLLSTLSGTSGQRLANEIATAEKVLSDYGPFLKSIESRLPAIEREIIAKKNTGELLSQDAGLYLAVFRKIGVHYHGLWSASVASHAQDFLDNRDWKRTFSDSMTGDPTSQLCRKVIEFHDGYLRDIHAHSAAMDEQMSRLSVAEQPEPVEAAAPRSRRNGRSSRGSTSPAAPVPSGEVTLSTAQQNAFVAVANQYNTSVERRFSRDNLERIAAGLQAARRQSIDNAVAVPEVIEKLTTGITIGVSAITFGTASGPAFALNNALKATVIAGLAGAATKLATQTPVDAAGLNLRVRLGEITSEQARADLFQKAGTNARTGGMIGLTVGVGGTAGQGTKLLVGNGLSGLGLSAGEAGTGLGAVGQAVSSAAGAFSASLAMSGTNIAATLTFPDMRYEAAFEQLAKRFEGQSLTPEQFQRELDAMCRTEKLAPLMFNDAIARAGYAALSGGAASNSNYLLTLMPRGAVLINVGSQVLFTAAAAYTVDGKVTPETMLDAAMASTLPGTHLGAKPVTPTVAPGQLTLPRLNGMMPQPALATAGGPPLTTSAGALQGTPPTTGTANLNPRPMLATATDPNRGANNRGQETAEELEQLADPPRVARSKLRSNNKSENRNHDQLKKGDDGDPRQHERHATGNLARQKVLEGEGEHKGGNAEYVVPKPDHSKNSAIKLEILRHELSLAEFRAEALATLQKNAIEVAKTGIIGGGRLVAKWVTPTIIVSGVIWAVKNALEEAPAVTKKAEKQFPQSFDNLKKPAESLIKNAGSAAVDGLGYVAEKLKDKASEMMADHRTKQIEEAVEQFDLAANDGNDPNRIARMERALADLKDAIGDVHTKETDELLSTWAKKLEREKKAAEVTGSSPAAKTSDDEAATDEVQRLLEKRKRN